MRARRSRSRRIWPRPTSHWRSLSEYGTLDFTQASEAYERALALAPGNAEVLRKAAHLQPAWGTSMRALRPPAAPSCSTRSLAKAITSLGRALYLARRYEEAVAAFAEVISLEPDFKATYGDRGFAYYGLGDLQSARASCETKPDYWGSQQCLAVIYDKLGRHADAEAELAKLKAAQGDTAAYQYATIYAQWGNRPKALEWLETALRLHDTGLEVLKTDPLLDPLRKEPRFQAIERSIRIKGRCGCRASPHRETLTVPSKVPIASRPQKSRLIIPYSAAVNRSASACVMCDQSGS